MQRNRTRQSISILLLLPVLIPLLFIVITDLGKWEIKWNSHDRLEESSALIQLRIPEKEVHWMDRREISVDGKMFDIKSQELINGLYYFTGHFDERETALQQKQQASHTENQQSIIQVFKSLQQLYFDPQEPGFFCPTPVPVIIISANNNLLTAILDVNTPPPQQYLPELL
jgi:hypothetical protein